MTTSMIAEDEEDPLPRHPATAEFAASNNNTPPPPLVLLVPRENFHVLTTTRVQGRGAAGSDCQQECSLQRSSSS